MRALTTPSFSPLLRTGWMAVWLGFWLIPEVGYAQANPRFPNAADPNYEKAYQAYRAEMGARPIVAPALGYDASSVDRPSSPQAAASSSSSGGLGSAFSSLGQSIKQSWNKLEEYLTPKEKVQKAPEPTSVFNPARPSADTYVAMARFCVENGRLAEAQQHYLNALRSDPRHVGALLGYAKLQEQLGHPTEAVQAYQRAMTLYPQEPAVFNNAGLCYARNGQLEMAARLLQRAVQLDPKKPLYRNNLAMVLVDMDRPDAALAHLRAVYPEAIARYNLGQLLLHKGDWEAAAQQFTAALEADPKMQAAQAWLEELARRKAAPAPGRRAEVARLSPRPGLPQSPKGAWSEITDLGPGEQSRLPSSPSTSPNRPPSRNSHLPQTPSESPPVQLEHPRIYGQPNGTFSSLPPSAGSPSGEEELAPLPPVNPSGP